MSHQFDNRHQHYQQPQKQGMSTGCIVFLVLGGIAGLGMLLFVGTCVAVFATAKPPTASTSSSASASPEARVADKEKTKPADPPAPPDPPPPPKTWTKVTAKELVAAYKENEVAADSKYKGEEVEITGAISSIASDLMDEPLISLSAGPAEFLSANLSGISKGTAMKLKKGQTITARCVCTGEVIGMPQLKDCTIQ